MPVIRPTRSVPTSSCEASLVFCRGADVDPRAIQRFRKNRAAMIGAGIVVFLVAFAFLAPLLVGHDPLESDFAAGRNSDGSPAGPSWVHPLGTDTNYRDELARLAHAAR